MDLNIIWQQCLMLLKDKFGEEAYSTWFRFLNINAHKQDNKIEVVANNRLSQDFIKNKYWRSINSILTELLDDGSITIELITKSNSNKSTSKVDRTSNNANASQDIKVNNVNVNVNTNNGADSDSNVYNSNNNKHSASYRKELKDHKSSSNNDNGNMSNRGSLNNLQSKKYELSGTLQHATKLNPNYSFDTLVRGNSNQLAYAIGMHITQKPGNKNHNPLFIYGGVGLGKTHLMQAIGNEIHRINPKAKIRYLHANDYIQDVVKASMRQGFDELKKYYNGLDLLLMDDIQFIAGDKTKTQEEFFYTFNTLLDKGRQVIMTCDTYPKNINNLNERLISRFASGLTVEIQPPELEMRVAILKRKAESTKINLDDEVAFFIGQNIKSNVRELEGALNKVVYHAQFSGKGISLPVAKEALMDILATDNRNVSIDDIQKTVCDFYKIRISDLLSTKRNQVIARPRQVAMSLAKELTQYSLPVIGNAFGGRNHTTVIHAQKTISALRQSDNKMEREYKLLIQMLSY